MLYYEYAGDVGDNMDSKHTSNTVEQSQASSATQYAMPTKANWRQARPPKPADAKQDLDLQAGAAFLAGVVHLFCACMTRFMQQNVFSGDTTTSDSSAPMQHTSTWVCFDFTCVTLAMQ